MKIVFTKLPNEGTIKVSLDGGYTFTDYEIEDIRENGILLSDNQDYRKIKIKGSSTVLSNLEIVKGISLSSTEHTNLSIQHEFPVYGKSQITRIYECYANDSNGDEEITEDDKTISIPTAKYVWIGNDDQQFYVNENASSVEIPTENSLILATNLGGYGTDWDFRFIDNKLVEFDCTRNAPFDDYKNGRLRYPEGDVQFEDKVFIENRLETEIIDDFQETLTITKNGIYTADYGKVFKSVIVNVSVETPM